jgi:hypothetical protein
MLVVKKQLRNPLRVYRIVIEDWTTDHLTGEKNLKDLILEIEGVKNA